MLKSMLEFLDSQSDVQISQIAYMQSTKRPTLPVRLSMSVSSTEKLKALMAHRIETSANHTANSPIAVSGLSVVPKVLGVFTGQGAQWPTMAAQLIASNPVAAHSFCRLDRALQSLPKGHRPEWNLVDELSAGSTNRLSEAAISQPLCTAVQLVLVDLLRLAGVKFHAVVGHSSGEIAAAYAAGYLSSHDAMLIAYYRGSFAKLATDASGRKGGMIAVETTYEDAKSLCELDAFNGRLWVAAHNSPTSVTLSGDIDAVEQARGILEEENKFARILRVDTAYHSEHMLLCVPQYLEALRNCNIKLLQPEHAAPTWYSSVHGGVAGIQDLESLPGQYWIDNMVQPVHLHTALQTLLDKDTISLSLEIGPHPALQKPVTESIQQLTGGSCPYSGILKRGKDDVEAVSDALGYIWSLFGPAAVNLGAFLKATHGHSKSLTALNLPPYPWDHDRILWAESRASKTSRIQDGRVHDLLGTPTPDSTAEHWHWKNVLKANEIKWLSGHSLQGQVVFPGTGYIALAMEAAMQIAHDSAKSVESIDLLNLEIRKAIAISNSADTELLVSMSNVSSVSSNASQITASFAAYSTISKESGHLIQNCHGNVCINLGNDVSNLFAERSPPPAGTTAVDVDRFYQVLRDDFGYHYDGPFRGLTRIQRKLGFATASIRCHEFDSTETPLPFHPGMLDSALQGLNAAYSAPGDGRLWSIVAPTFCQRVTLIPAFCGITIRDQVDIDCSITDSSESSMAGDVDVYSANYTQKFIEIEGMRFSPFAAATPKDDRLLFQEAILSVDKPDAEIVFGNRQASGEEQQRGLDAERAAFFYLKTLHLSVSPDQREQLPWYRQALIKNAERVYRQVNSGEYPFAPQHWIDDSREFIVDLMDSYGEDAEFQLTKAVGENIMLPSVLSGETSILEFMTKDSYLDKYYKQAVGFAVLNDLVAGIMNQICTKYPHTDILEIGAGTGGATAAILERIEDKFSSYTYTDISSAFFERAANEKFKLNAHSMAFKTLNIEEDCVSQGFQPQSFDIIVASNVLHATKSLKTTLENTRRLLKPGGYLVLLEVIRTDVLRHGLVMGGLPGWWIGEQDGRHGGPSITVLEWDSVLRETGFAGIETHSPMPDPVVVPGSVMVSRAQDDEFGPLQAPLEHDPPAKNGTAVIIGGKTPHTAGLNAGLIPLLTPFFDRFIHFSCLDAILDASELTGKYHILSLTEFDSNLFELMDESRWQKLQQLLGSASSVLWLLQDTQSAGLYGGVTLGLFRTLFYELPGTLLQTLGICGGLELLESNPVVVAELMLRLRTMNLAATSGYLDKVLWVFEPELVLQNDKLYITRVRPQAEQNARYNSIRRPITALQNIDVARVTLSRKGRSYMLQQSHVPAATDNNALSIRVSCSLLSSIKTPFGYAFIALGTNSETGGKVLCFSDRNSSIITVHPSWTIPLDQDGWDIVDEQYLSFAVAELMVQQIISIVPIAGTTLIHEPDPVAGMLLAKRFADIKRTVAFTTSRLELKGRRNWLYIHEASTKRIIDLAVPDNVSLYIDGAEPDESRSCSRTLGSRIMASLSETCHRVSVAALVSHEASVLPHVAPISVTHLLQKIASFASSMRNSVPEGAPFDMLSLKQVVSPNSRPKRGSLIDWKPESAIPVSIQSVLARKDLFREDRTYWLAGLSGDIGRSLADFMAAHGAKYIALSSRTPNIDQCWVQSHSERDTTVEYLSCDLTDYDSVKAAHDKIISSMPALGGVANGAMILRDASFMKLSYEDFEAVLRTKVESSINLNRLFDKCAAQPALDWFIGFSSIVGTTGNPGQAAYSAGNCFMKALVNQRCLQGLAGSVIDISRVIGVGYIERERSGRLTKEHQQRLATRSGALAMSETDLHHLFAEAIVSGRPDSGLNPEIITGLAPITHEESQDAFWATNARFALLIRQGITNTSSNDDNAAEIPVKQLLKAALTTEHIRTILLSAITGKLRASMFLLESDSMSDSIPLVDIGVDSLVSVELRAWFLKELGVDVPVMKILSGVTIAELVDGALVQLPRDLLHPDVKGV